MNIIRSFFLFSCLAGLLAFTATLTGISGNAVAGQQTVKAEVIKVIDGATLFVKSKDTGKEYTVKLYGIACYPMPESQYETPDPFAQKAKEATEKLVDMSKDINVTKLDDRYNPTVGIVYFPQLNITLQHQLLNSGLAWVDKKECTNWGTCKTFRNIQENAKIYQQNIWGTDPPALPQDNKKP